MSTNGVISLYFGASYYKKLMDVDKNGRYVDYVKEITGMDVSLRNEMWINGRTCVLQIKRLSHQLMNILHTLA
jgi:hypothetical protein